MTRRSFNEWSGWLKWAATGLSSFRVLISDLWPFIVMWRGFSVSPTYCSPHLLHWIKQTKFFVLHVNENLVLCLIPVLWLVKLSFLILMLQVLQRVLKQGLLPVCVGVLSFFSLASMSKSLRLCGRLNATRVGQWWLPWVYLKHGECSDVSSVSSLFWRGAYHSSYN